VSELRCLVLRGLPKELEEEVNKFLATTSPRLEHVLQSEENGLVSLTIFYRLERAAVGG
jgi:hypothetical protein